MMYPSADGYFIRDTGTRFQITPTGRVTAVFIKESVIENPTLLEFTGVYDKNGKPVYEGDIVEKNDSKFCKRGEVQMPEGTWMVVEDETHYFNLHFYQDQIHVIGNKFDNPKLNE